MKHEQSASFKSRHRDLQELVREHKKIRTHNLEFKEGDSQENYLLFAEASLILLILERFLRILPQLKSKEKDTLANLLQRATGKRKSLLQFIDLETDEPITEKGRKKRIILAITEVRNSLLHGNFEQAAQLAGCKSREEYFKTKFSSEVETIYRITDKLVTQIDPRTGSKILK